MTTLEGHRNPIRRLEVHGAYLYSQGAKTVRVWDLSSFRCVGVVQGADIGGSMKAMAVGPGGVLYVGGQDCKVKAYRLLARAGSVEPGVSAAASGGGAAAPTLSPLTAVTALPADAAAAAAAATAAAAAAVAAAGSEGAAAAVAAADRAAAGRPHRIFASCAPAGASPMDEECETPQSPTFITAGDLTCRACVHAAAAPAAQTDPASSHCSSVTALALCGDYICSASTDSTIRVWRAESLELVRVLRGHRGSVLALYGAGPLLLSGGRDHLIRVWDSETLVCRRTLRWAGEGACGEPWRVFVWANSMGLGVVVR